MSGIKKVIHNGKEILYIDYRGTRSDSEMIEILKQAQQIIIEENKEYLQLTNMTGAFATPGYMKEAKKIAAETPKLAKKRAIIGIDSPGRKILLQAYNLVLGGQGIKPFATEQEALDYLVK